MDKRVRTDSPHHPPIPRYIVGYGGAVCLDVAEATQAVAAGEDTTNLMETVGSI